MTSAENVYFNSFQTVFEVAYVFNRAASDGLKGAFSQPDFWVFEYAVLSFFST